MTELPAQKRLSHRIIPMLILSAGLILMVIKIIADSEPGAIPLAMVITGLVWLWFLRRQGTRSA